MKLREKNLLFLNSLPSDFSILFTIGFTFKVCWVLYSLLNHISTEKTGFILIILSTNFAFRCIEQSILRIWCSGRNCDEIFCFYFSLSVIVSLERVVSGKSRSWKFLVNESKIYVIKVKGMRYVFNPFFFLQVEIFTQSYFVNKSERAHFYHF